MRRRSNRNPHFAVINDPRTLTSRKTHTEDAALTLQALEKYQLLVYLVTISTGLVVGTLWPATGGSLETLLWPVLGVLLYVTFTQVPLNHISDALRDHRFLLAAVVGNFLVVPLLVWALMRLLPDQPAVHLGVVLVLLVPCTDWFITFTHLGGGDTRHAIAFSPISLLLQILLLPLYLWLFLGADMVVAVAHREMLTAFMGLIVAPLALAFVTELWVNDKPQRVRVAEKLGWLPVPLLALVLFIVVASQVSLVTASLALLAPLALVFILFLLATPILARLMATALSLPPRQGRVLAFSMGSRNSFVVLPLALALPEPLQAAVVVVVFQSLVELLGMLFFLWWIPRRLFKTF